MRILVWDELTADLDAQRVALSLSAFSGALSRRAVEVYRRRRHVLPEYVGLYAVDGRDLLGQTMVLRLPFRTTEGPTTVAGIASVTTRADSGRRGVARTLLGEAHRRESEAGSSHAILWTNRSWYAHALYEKLGYRDVYVPSVAIRGPPVPFARRRTGRLRSARPSDLECLERLHARFARGRFGFSPRPAGSFTVEHEAGDLPLAQLRVYPASGPPEGYAVLQEGRGGVLFSGEIVGNRAASAAIVGELERRAKGGPLLLSYTPVEDRRSFLRRRGYVVRHNAVWQVLMARPLRGRWTRTGATDALGASTRAFVCMQRDRF